MLTCEAQQVLHHEVCCTECGAAIHASKAMQEQGSVLCPLLIHKFDHCLTANFPNPLCFKPTFSDIGKTLCVSSVASKCVSSKG